jgi:hypothetical protein
MNNVGCIELLLQLETGKCIALQESLAQQFLDSSQEFLEFALSPGVGAAGGSRPGADGDTHAHAPAAARLQWLSESDQRAMLAEVVWPVSEQPDVFACGRTALVETVASALVGLGHATQRIKTGRFGPSGETA